MIRYLRSQIGTTEVSQRQNPHRELLNVWKAFQKFDNGRRCLAPSAARDALDSLGLHIDERAAKLLIEQADRNCNNCLELPEFAALVAQLVPADVTAAFLAHGGAAL